MVASSSGGHEPEAFDALMEDLRGRYKQWAIEDLNTGLRPRNLALLPPLSELENGARALAEVRGMHVEREPVTGMPAASGFGLGEARLSRA
jgi:hypothetical protein